MLLVMPPKIGHLSKLLSLSYFILNNMNKICILRKIHQSVVQNFDSCNSRTINGRACTCTTSERTA